MSLRKSPRITPALLAANRANARKCTAPRTARGKGRTVLNALKHCRYSRAFREKLPECCDLWLGRTISSNFKLEEQTLNVIENKGPAKFAGGGNLECL